MVSCMGDLHIWSLKNNTLIPDVDIGCFTYHDKSETVINTDQPYYEEKVNYTESRDATWTPKNKRPDRVRDSLKEVEDILSGQRCVRAKWFSKRVLQLFLSNGAIVTLLISLHTGDVDKIIIDKTLVGKLSADTPSDVLITENFLVIAYPDRPKLDYVYFTKKLPPTDTARRIDKLSVFEPKVTQTEVPGPLGRRLDRHLTSNMHHNLVAVWWPTASEEAWPWSPMTGDQERTNLCLLIVSSSRLDLVTNVRTECDPLDISFSMLQPHQLLSVERSGGTGSDISAHICTYQANTNKIQRMTVTTVPLKSVVVCAGRSAMEDKTLIGCQDGTLVLYDEIRKVTQMTSTPLTPSSIVWHPSGVLVVVASTKGQFQVFDMALAPLLFQLVAENPTTSTMLEIESYFRSSPSVAQLKWSPLLEAEEHVAECTDGLFIGCDRGPLCMLQLHLGVMSQGRLSPLLLVHAYIKHRQIDEAVNILSALSWNSDGPMCFAALSTIINQLLREPLNPNREAQLEAALGTFYSPPRPLSEGTVLEFRDPISRMARRFFQHLLRFSRFDKAFLLAVDIGARDLFMDIHYLALDKGETALAEVARRKAEQLDNDSLTSESVDGFDDTEDSEGGDSLDDSYSEDGEMDDSNVVAPPPRPPKRTPAASAASVGRPLPPIPPEPRYAAPQLDPRFAPRRRHQRQHLHSQIWEQGYMYMPEAALQQLEEELSAEMYTEYTAALLDEIPPPQVPQDSNRDGAREVQEGDQSSKSVKVIHFGIV